MEHRPITQPNLFTNSWTPTHYIHKSFVEWWWGWNRRWYHIGCGRHQVTDILESWWGGYQRWYQIRCGRHHITDTLGNQTRVRTVDSFSYSNDILCILYHNIYCVVYVYIRLYDHIFRYTRVYIYIFGRMRKKDFRRQSSSHT